MYRSSLKRIEPFLWRPNGKNRNFSTEDKMPVSFEDVSRALYRIQGGVRRTVSAFIRMSTNIFDVVTCAALRFQPIFERNLRVQSLPQEGLHAVHWKLQREVNFEQYNIYGNWSS